MIHLSHLSLHLSSGVESSDRHVPNAIIHAEPKSQTLARPKGDGLGHGKDSDDFYSGSASGSIKCSKALGSQHHGYQ